MKSELLGLTRWKRFRDGVKLCYSGRLQHVTVCSSHRVSDTILVANDMSLVCGTTAMNVGLIFVPVSVYQMLRGA